MKKLSLITLFIWLLASTIPAYSDYYGKHKKQCSISGEKSGCKRHGDRCGNHRCPITSKLMKKACFFLSHADELGLSEDQTKRIKGIEMEVKKQMILGEAQMKIAFIDMTAKLHEETLDIEGLNAMVDSFSAGMASSTKKTIQSFADLQGVLTPEQMAKAKEIWKKN